jgi:hypothetical protein
MERCVPTSGVEDLQPYFFLVDIEITGDKIVNPTRIVLEPMERSVPAGSETDNFFN